MVAGADGDALVVQYGADVVRMHPLDREADDAGAFLGPEQAHAVDPPQRLAAFADQGGFVRMDGVEANALHPVDRRVQPDGADDMRRSCFEALRRRREGGALERHVVDHRSAALVRRHGLEQIGAAPQSADAGRAVQFVRRQSIEIATDRGDIDRDPRRRLAAVEQQQRTFRMRDFRRAPGVEDRAEHVRDMGEGDDAMVVGNHRLGGVQIDAAVGGQRDDVELVARQLPGDDVAVML